MSNLSNPAYLNSRGPYFRIKFNSLPLYTRYVAGLQEKYSDAIAWMENLKRNKLYHQYMQYLQKLPKKPKLQQQQSSEEEDSAEGSGDIFEDDVFGGALKDIEHKEYENYQDYVDEVRRLRHDYAEAINFMNDKKLDPMYKKYQRYLRALPKKNKFVYTPTGRQMMKDLIMDAGVKAIASKPVYWSARLQHRKDKYETSGRKRFSRILGKDNKYNTILSSVSVPAAKDRRMDEDVYMAVYERTPRNLRHKISTKNPRRKSPGKRDKERNKPPVVDSDFLWDEYEPSGINKNGEELDNPRDKANKGIEAYRSSVLNKLYDRFSSVQSAPRVPGPPRDDDDDDDDDDGDGPSLLPSRGGVGDDIDLSGLSMSVSPLRLSNTGKKGRKGVRRPRIIVRDEAASDDEYQPPFTNGPATPAAATAQEPERSTKRRRGLDKTYELRPRNNRATAPPQPRKPVQKRSRKETAPVTTAPVTTATSRQRYNLRPRKT